MSVLLVFLGIVTVLIGGPVMLFKQYRRALREAAHVDGNDRLPQARVHSTVADIRSEGNAIARQRQALRRGVFRGLLPAWVLGLVLLLLGVAVSHV